MRTPQVFQKYKKKENKRVFFFLSYAIFIHERVNHQKYIVRSYFTVFAASFFSTKDKLNYLAIKFLNVAFNVI